MLHLEYYWWSGPALAEYFSMAASKLVPSAIFHWHVVLIMKTKPEQCIKSEIKAKNFKQWILKPILAIGLEKAILKDFQHNMGNTQCHTSSHP